MSQNLRVGAVGLGRLGRHHAENLAFRIPGVELAAVCSVVLDEVLEARKALGNPNGFLQFEEMLHRSALDAVVLTTPSHLHAAHIEAALNAGLHVFCEKPLATTIADAERAISASARHPHRAVMIGFMRRFDPSYRFVKQQIDAGVIGRPILFRGYSVDPASAIEGTLRFLPQSAGQFLDMAVHDIDLARWLLGAEPREVYALGGCYAYPEFAEYGDGDHVAALMPFENGAMAFFFAGRTAPHGYNIETEIVGTNGTLRVNAVPAQNRVEILDAGGVRRTCEQHFLERFRDAYLNELLHFIDCIRNERRPEIGLVDGLAATRIALAATEAFQRQCVVHLDKISPHTSR
jgi:myo-inositol 2-dehydrogenase/D-chiro-inositol 1-dehydrogenase